MSMDDASADPRRESSSWYGREDVARRYATYQTPGTRQFRHRSPERRVLERLLASFPPARRALDMPCGTGRYLPLLQGAGAVSAADLSPAMASAARELAPHRDVLQADLFHLPFADRAFDLVLCMRFLHHVPDDDARRRCLAELGRVCGDRLVCSYFERRSAKHAVRRFRAWRRGRPSLRFGVRFRVLQRQLEQAGFRVEKVYSPFGILSENRVVVCRRD